MIPWRRRRRNLLARVDEVEEIYFEEGTIIVGGKIPFVATTGKTRLVYSYIVSYWLLHLRLIIVTTWSTNVNYNS